MNLCSMIVYNNEYVTQGGNTLLLGRDTANPLPTALDLSFLTEPILKVATTS